MFEVKKIGQKSKNKIGQKSNKYNTTTRGARSCYFAASSSTATVVVVVVVVIVVVVVVVALYPIYVLPLCEGITRAYSLHGLDCVSAAC
jgi:hypothetical protein